MLNGLIQLFVRQKGEQFKGTAARTPQCHSHLESDLKAPVWESVHLGIINDMSGDCGAVELLSENKRFKIWVQLQNLFLPTAGRSPHYQQYWKSVSFQRLLQWGKNKMARKSLIWIILKCDSFASQSKSRPLSVWGDGVRMADVFRSFKKYFDRIEIHRLVDPLKALELSLFKGGLTQWSEDLNQC